MKKIKKNLSKLIIIIIKVYLIIEFRPIIIIWDIFDSYKFLYLNGKFINY
jgi:hypothetical protein